MNGQISASEEAKFTTLFRTIDDLNTVLSSLKEQLKEILPVREGSDLWWERENAKAIKSIKAGKGIKCGSYEEAVKYLAF